MKPTIGTEHFCIFAPPHGHTKFLGIIKAEVTQRQAVGLCTIDWSSPELGPFLRDQCYHHQCILVLGTAHPMLEGTAHRPNQVAYCEYHGGTRHHIAAGEWCFLCERIRAWALDVIKDWGNHPPDKRKQALEGARRTESGIISPDLLDWGVAIGILSLFSDQQSRKVLRQQLNTTPADALERVTRHHSYLKRLLER